MKIFYTMGKKHILEFKDIAVQRTTIEHILFKQVHEKDAYIHSHFKPQCIY